MLLLLYACAVLRSSLAPPPYCMMATATARSKELVYSSPLGPLKLTATAEGILAVKYLFGRGEGEDVERARSVPVKCEGDAEHFSEKEAESHLKICSKWLDAYFQGTLLKSPPPRPKLALANKGTNRYLAVTR